MFFINPRLNDIQIGQEGSPTFRQDQAIAKKGRSGS
jgi:hypothetical protein